MTAIALTDSEVTLFFRGLERSVGVHLDLSKRYLLNARLEPVSNRLGYSSVDTLVRALNQMDLLETRQQAYAALTTNETMFFRDPELFELLKNRLLPALIKRRADSRRIRIWSAAASTGQEVYSLAMLIRLHFPDLKNWELEIRGSDVSHSVIQTARAGIFNDRETSRGLPLIYFNTFFTKADCGRHKLSDEIRNMVTFDWFNLMSDRFSNRRYDLILMRNVLIYFSLKNKITVLEKANQALADADSALLLGGAESVNGNPRFVMNRDPRWHFYTKKREG